MRMNDEYIPTPSRKATRLVVHTPRIAHHPHVDERFAGAQLGDDPGARTARPKAVRPIAAAEPQPQLVAWLTASSTAVRPTDISARGEPVDLARRLDRRLGHEAPAWPRDATDDRDQREPEQPVVGEVVDDRPRRARRRAPPPIPSSADISPMPPATRSRGNSSRMIPKASGKMPPPTPWITRPTTITADRAWRPPRPACRRRARRGRSMSTRSLPCMSPSRPTIGVATEALSR